MKNLLKIITMVFVLSLVSMAMSEAFSQTQLSVLDSKWSWIKKKIYQQDPPPVDYLIIGSSGIWTAMDPAIMQAAIGKQTRILNFGRNWIGRDVDYITLKHALC